MKWYFLICILVAVAIFVPEAAAALLISAAILGTIGTIILFFGLPAKKNHGEV